MKTLSTKKFGSYWFETGTPTYLITLLQLHDYNLETMSAVETDADVLNSTDGGSTDPIPVIYQSGYLTIKDYCYVLEFKLDGTAEEALQQIQDKNYTLPFEMNGQKIIRIGMNFSNEMRNIDGVVVG